MVTKTFVADLQQIMAQEDVRTGLLRVGVYTAGAVALTAIGAPVMAGALDMTSVASVYGANLWAAGQYPYLSSDFIATHIQDGQEIFGHQGFESGLFDRAAAESQSPGILQQCRDTVTKVRAVTPNEAWMRIIETAGYALDKIEVALKPAVQMALDTKDYLGDRYSATKEVSLAVVSVIALGVSLRDTFRKATNYGRRLFGLPEKLSPEEKAFADLSDAVMAGLAKTKEELTSDLSKDVSSDIDARLQRMERQIIDTLKQEIAAAGAIPGAVRSGVCAETSASIRFDPQSLLNANIAANVALAGADALRSLDMKEAEINALAEKSSGILWMSDTLHERMNEIAGKTLGKEVDLTGLRGALSQPEIIREGRRKLKFSVNRGLHQELLASGVSMDRLGKMLEQTARATRDAREASEVEAFLSAMDQPSAGVLREAADPAAERDHALHISIN